MRLITKLKSIEIPESFNLDDVDFVLKAIEDGISPDPDLSFLDFCDTHCIVPKSTGASRYGKYSSDFTPHAKEIIRALDISNKCRRVVAKISSQMFKTQISLNWMTYIVAQHPANIIMLQPTGTLHKRIVNRIQKIISDTSRIKNLFAPPNSKTEINNASIKNFSGGGLFLGSAGSASNLSELPAKYAICDEVSRYVNNVDGEGDVIKLVEGRQTTFIDAKSYYFSSPTILGECKISELYEKGTKRKALARCIHCDTAQELIFENFKQDEHGEAYYPCQSCGGIHYEKDKTEMFSEGLYSEPLESDGETESFECSTLFAPYGSISWTKLYNEYIAAKKDIDEKADSNLMITFYNIRLARAWTNETQTTTTDKLIERSEDYEIGIAQEKVTFLTAAVDTQSNRFEVAVYGWSYGMEGWLVDYKIIYGSPDDAATKSLLLEYLTKSFKHESGKYLKIKCTFIDSGGHFTTDIYDFCRRNKSRNIFAIKGSSAKTYKIIKNANYIDYNFQGKNIQKGLKLFHIGTDVAKDHIFSKLHKSKGYGAIHFTKKLPIEFFDGILSEYRDVKIKNGRKVTYWIKKTNVANEPLDLLVYNIAAATHLQIDRMTEIDVMKYRKKNGLEDTIDCSIEENDNEDELLETINNELSEETEETKEYINSEVISKKKKYRLKAGSGFNNIKF